jgi:hypothetical protein
MRGLRALGVSTPTYVGPVLTPQGAPSDRFPDYPSLPRSGVTLSLTDGVRSERQKKNPDALIEAWPLAWATLRTFYR